VSSDPGSRVLDELMITEGGRCEVGQDSIGIVTFRGNKDMDEIFSSR